MKRILCLAVTIVVIASAFTCAVGAVSYSDLEPTYSVYSDYTDYKNAQNVRDDRMQNRANCYGYAMRLHYGGETLPNTSVTIEVNDLYLTLAENNHYLQQPGEFFDKTEINMKNYKGLMEYYYNHGVNDSNFSKECDVDTVYQLLSLDCNQLGYNVSFVGRYSAGEYFTPPTASANSNMRLVALVESRTLIDYHFYMQDNDNKWTHKPGNLAALSTCGVCTDSNGDPVELNNSTIGTHIYCKSSPYATEPYYGEVILFQITAPGSSDRYHSNGHIKDSAKTSTSSQLIPGDYLRSAKVIEDADTETIGEHIDYIGDEDYFIFNVPTTGSYDFTFWKGNEYAYRFYIGEVGDSFTMIYTTTHTLTAATESVDFTKTLQAGKRYYMKVIAYGQTEFDYLISYSIFIN